MQGNHTSLSGKAPGRGLSLVPVLVLLAAVVIFHRGVLFDRGLAIPWDIQTYHLPLATAYADALSEGSLPLWDPYAYAGRPLLANPLAAVFYPGTLLSVLPGRDGLLFRVEGMAIIHVFLAGLFTYWLARRVALGRGAALVAGLIFELGALFASQLEHLPLVCGAPWLVLAWLALFIPRRWTVPVLAAALTLNFLLGFTAVTIMVGASTLLLAILLWLSGRAERRLPGYVVLAALLAAGLATVQWWPALELVQHSVGQYRTDWLKAGGGIPVAALVSLVWPNYWGLFDLSTFHAPYEPTHLYLYSGWAALALAGLALVRRRGLAPIFTLVSMMSLVLMLGCSTPVGTTLYRCAPLFLKNTIYWYPWMAAFLLAWSLLAAHGAQAWVRGRLAMILLVLLIAIDLIGVGSGRPFNMERLAADPRVAGQAIEGSMATYQELRLITGEGRYDIVGLALPAVSQAPIFRLRTGSGYDPLTLERLIQVRLGFARGERWGAYYAVEDTAAPVVDLLGIRALLIRDGEPRPAAKWVAASTNSGWTIYRNDHALPRYRLVGKVRRAADLGESAVWVHNRSNDFSGEAIAEGFELIAGSTGTVRIVSEARQAITVETDAAGPSFLVTSEANYPGWEARIDGVAVPIIYANVAFRGLPVPAGRHCVDMIFRQRGLRGAAAVTLVASLVWMWLMVRAVRFHFARPDNPRTSGGPASGSADRAST